MATGNTDYGVVGLLSTTINHFIRKLEEQSWNKTVLLNELSKGGIPSQNGNQIIQPLLYGDTSAKGSFADTDVFSAPTRDGITAAAFDFRQYYASIMISGVELAKNSSTEAVLSLLKARLRQAMLTISKDMNVMLFSDGSGNGGKDFDGLASAVAAANTFGNIDRTDATNSWWRSQLVDQAGVLALVEMRQAYNNIADGTEKADIAITTQAGFEAYEALMDNTVRQESTRLGDLGFDSLMFKSVPITFDRDCTTETMYFLNTDYLELVSLDGKWFDVSEWLKPTNQDVQYKNILLYGNLTCSNANRQGTLFGITDAA